MKKEKVTYKKRLFAIYYTVIIQTEKNAYQSVSEMASSNQVNNLIRMLRQSIRLHNKNFKSRSK